MYGNPGHPFRVTAVRDETGLLTLLSYDENNILFALERGRQRLCVSSDQVGSPRVVANASGVIVKEVDYDAYGFVRSDSAPGFDLPLGYADGLPDPSTGLVHFGMRDYDVIAGRQSV